MATVGIERVKMNFRKKIENITQERTERALYFILSTGGAYAATMTPIDTSNLINSQTAPQIKYRPGKTTGVIGYTARYAHAVHEAPGVLKGLPRADFGVTRAGQAFGGGTKVGNYWDPDAEPGFLVKGFAQVRPEIPALLKKAYRRVD